MSFSNEIKELVDLLERYRRNKMPMTNTNGRMRNIEFASIPDTLHLQNDPNPITAHYSTYTQPGCLPLQRYNPGRQYYKNAR